MAAVALCFANNMICFSKVGRCALFAALIFGGVGDVTAKPNIIFVLTDDLGYGDVGVFFQNLRATNNVRSEPWHLTPQLDQLAAEGTQLRRHYCAAPVCAPSRASLLLGVSQGHANVRDNQFDKALENNHTLATVMKEAGYATVAIGKWGLQGGKMSGDEDVSAVDADKDSPVWPAYPTKRGFDDYFGYVRHADGHEHYPKEGLYSRKPKQVWDNNREVSAGLDKCYTADLWTARAKHWIQAHQAAKPEQPFFMYLAYDTPHAVLELPTQAYPAGGGTNGGLQWLGTPGHMINTASGKIDSYYYPEYAHATWDDDHNAATPEVPWPDVNKRYACSVRRIDDGVGDLLTLLGQLNLATNTLVVFTSDNGPSRESYLPGNIEPDFFSSFGPFDGIKRDTWEGGICVGAIARWPGVIQPHQVSMLASTSYDWMPTLAEAAGVATPARSDGVSLLPTLTGKGAQREPQVYIEYYESGKTPSYQAFAPAHRGRVRNQMQVIRLGGYQGVRYNLKSAADDFEIYDLDADPQQTNNLALRPQFAALEQQMKDRVLQLRRPDAAAPRPYDATPVPATTNSVFTNGVLNYAVYQGQWTWVPEFAALTAVSTGTVAGLDLSVQPRAENFGIAYRGFLTVPGEGDYTFYLQSDSGAHFRIHEATVIDDDFNHTGGEVAGTIRLAAGRHPFRLYYRHGSGPQLLTLNYSGPGFAKQAIAPVNFSLAGTAAAEPQAADDFGSTAKNEPVLIPVLANDTDDGWPQPLQISAVTQPANGLAAQEGQRIRYTPRQNFTGRDQFTYTITDGANTATATVKVVVGDSPAISADRAIGRWPGPFQLDGKTAPVTVTDSFQPPTGSSPRTTAAWIKTEAAGAIIAWGPNNQSGRKWIMRVEDAAASPGVLRVEVGGGFVRGKKDLRDGNWHHVAAVLPAAASPNVSAVQLYVDDVLETEAVSSPGKIQTVAAKVTIGVDSQERYFTGVIAEAQIFPRALTAPEIAALFAANKPDGHAPTR